MTNNGSTAHDLIARLSALPIHDLPPERTQRLAAAARTRLALAKSRPRRAGTFLQLEAGGVILAATAYMAWAVTRVLVLVGIMGGG